MATLRWRGDAPAVAQKTTATPGNVEIGDQFLLTINGKSVSYTATAATVADVVGGLVTAIGESSIPEFAEIVASDTTSEVTLTAKTAGQPFTVASSAINGGATDDQTLTISTTTVSSGPQHWDTSDNWSTGNLPGNTDDVYIENSDTSILYGLGQSAISLNSLNIAASFTGQIGLEAVNESGTSPITKMHCEDDWLF